MSNVIILHGVGSTPNDFWFPHVKAQLEEKGHSVLLPHLPQPDDPDISVYVPWLREHAMFSNETVLIGHSSGASIILALLEKIDTKIRQAILVSAFLTRGGERPAKAVKAHEEAYDWEKIRSSVGQVICINSTNDPWGCDDVQGRKIFDRVGGLLIVNSEGHMGSTYYKQPYKEFPLISKLIE